MPQMEILTLGQFFVKCRSSTLSEELSKSKKLRKLFMFFIVNKGKRINSESIVETLWPDQSYSCPRQAEHNLVYRLRQLLEDSYSSGENPFSLKYSQNGYCFTLGPHCRLDADELASLSSKANALRHANRAEAKEILREAISFYRGDFLPEYAGEHWVMPARHFYYRIYLKSLLGLIDLLKEEDDYAEIQKVCEDAFLVDFFAREEEVHLRYINALWEQGKDSVQLSSQK